VEAAADTSVDGAVTALESGLPDVEGTSPDVAVVHGPELGDDPVVLEERRMVVTDEKVGPSEGVSSKLVDEAVSSELCADVNELVSHDDCVEELNIEVWLALAGVVLDAVVVEVAADTVVDDTVLTLLEPEL
jgi:hypothetical protein